jgi:RNA polymerase sigma factor (sigma-70 family)
VEDLASEVWVRVLENPPDPFSEAWLRTVAANVCKNHLKRLALEHRLFEPILVPEESPLDDGDDLGSPEPSVPSEESRILAQLDLEKLPRDVYEVLALRYLKDLSHKQIADELGCSENAAQKKVATALEKARRILGG